MKPRNILLVEDNPSDEALTLRVLSKNGLVKQVVVTRDGAEALDYLFCSGMFAGRDQSDAPAVVLMDLNLPKLSGLDALKRIRENPDTKLLPVVILTSSDEEEDRCRGYECGANSFVRKPVEFDKFATAIQQLGLYWLLLNEPAPRGNGTPLPHET